jgi:hypothetical protein
MAHGLVLLALGGLALAGAIWAIWWIPKRQVRHVAPNGRRKAENDARTTLVQALTGLGIVASFSLTWYQINATQQTANAGERAANQTLTLTLAAQENDRFTQGLSELSAVDSSGHKLLSERIGGFYSLAELAHDAPQKYASAVTDVVTAYIRDAIPWHSQDLKASLAANRLTCEPQPPPPQLTSDVLAALSVLRDGEFRLARVDLSDTDLEDANLTGGRFSHADFSGSNLDGADFVDASLAHADFEGASAQAACFEGADLRAADFSDVGFVLRTGEHRPVYLPGAIFSFACLRSTVFDDAVMPAVEVKDADVTGASLAGADIRGALFSGSIGLTAGQWHRARERPALPVAPAASIPVAACHGVGGGGAS